MIEVSTICNINGTELALLEVRASIRVSVSSFQTVQTWVAPSCLAEVLAKYSRVTGVAPVFSRTRKTHPVTAMRNDSNYLDRRFLLMGARSGLEGHCKGRHSMVGPAAMYPDDSYSHTHHDRQVASSLTHIYHMKNRPQKALEKDFVCALRSVAVSG